MGALVLFFILSTRAAHQQTCEKEVRCGDSVSSASKRGPHVSSRFFLGGWVHDIAKGGVETAS